MNGILIGSKKTTKREVTRIDVPDALGRVETADANASGITLEGGIRFDAGGEDLDIVASSPSSLQTL